MYIYIYIYIYILYVSKMILNRLNFTCFLCLMAYQPLWVIKYQSHPCKITAVILFNPELVR